jgi:hypothetical protein
MNREWIGGDRIVQVSVCVCVCVCEYVAWDEGMGETSELHMQLARRTNVPSVLLSNIELLWSSTKFAEMTDVGVLSFFWEILCGSK